MGSDILIDISAAVNQGAGIGRYARELTRELIPLLPNRSTQLWMAADPDPADPQLISRDPWRSVCVTKSRLSRRNVDRLSARGQLPVGTLLRSGNPGDSYSPDFTTPPGSREHITVHDLAWLHPEAQTSPALTRYLEPVVGRAIHRAATVFTVSHAIRDEILDRFSIQPERVVVAPNAPAMHFFDPVPHSAESLAVLGVRQPFILFVGTIEPRKNLNTLLEAMRYLPDELSLIVVGKSGWHAENQLSPIARLDLASRVVRLGYVGDATLSGLFAAASTLVYPSRYEGFGLPIVEALASGTPVAASDLTVFREVGGSAVDYFDPCDAEAVARAIEDSLAPERQSDAARQRRQDRARAFDWTSSARVVADRLTAGL